MIDGGAYSQTLGAETCRKGWEPNNQGQVLRDPGQMERSECLAKCREDAWCNAFAWEMSNRQCCLKTGFEISTAGAGGSGNNYEFCYFPQGRSCPFSEVHAHCCRSADFLSAAM